MADKQIPWEDHLFERKTVRELGDIRRTAVGFANSVMPGHTAVIPVDWFGGISRVTDSERTGIRNASARQSSEPAIANRERNLRLATSRSTNRSSMSAVCLPAGQAPTGSYDCDLDGLKVTGLGIDDFVMLIM